MRDAIHHPDAPATAMIAALAGSSVTVAELDSALRYTAVYSPGLLLDGCAAVGRTDVEIHGPQGEPLMALARAALACGAPQGTQVSLVRGSGALHLDVRLTPVGDDAADRRLAMLATERAGAPDQTPHQARWRFLVAEDDRRRSGDLLRTIFEGLSDGLLLIGHDGMVLAANHQVSALLSVEGAALHGRLWGEIVGERPGLPTISVGEGLSDGQARRERVGVTDHVGRKRILDIQTLPVQAEDGSIDQLLVHMRDVTEQIQLEARMMERERFAATGQLAATVAHEVNTPLQAIESCLHLVGRVEDEAERARYLRLAREEIKRVGYTLRQLLDLYRPSVTRAPLDMNGLIERVLMLTSNSLARRLIQIERDLSNDLPVVLGRADEITQVLINLVFNAMQAMPKGGLLRLESRRGQSAAGRLCLLVQVRDSGVGIAPELHQRIFDPFFTTRADGTGLGLSVCRRIIDGHGGSLRVESVPDQGSCFTIEIPIS